MGNDRYAGVRRLPDAPIAGESYRMVGIADIYANKTAGVYAHHKAVG